MLTVPQATAKARLALCEACPHYRKNMPQTRPLGRFGGLKCDLCGCYMPVKVTLKGASCPKKKW